MFAGREGGVSVLDVCNDCFGFSPDDFESKFNFHPLEDLPPPEDYRHVNKVYPSKNNKGES